MASCHLMGALESSLWLFHVAYVVEEQELRGYQAPGRVQARGEGSLDLAAISREV